MKNFLLTAWRIVCKVFEIVIPVAVFLYFAVQVTSIKVLQKQEIEASSQIVDTQVAIYDALVQTQASNLIIQEQLAEGIEKAKKDAIKNQNEIMKVIYGVDKRSIDRSQGIVDGVNKTVTDLNYILQKPSYDYLKNITVILIARDKNADSLPAGQRGWLGTGVIIAIDNDFTYILTNHHIVDKFSDGKRDYYVKDGDNKYPLTLIKDSKDENVDLALVRIDGHIDGKIAVIGFGPEPKAQDPVYLVGHNLGRPYLYDEGQVAGFDDDYLVVDMPIGPGNSGSGVINKDGKLVGLLFAGSIIQEDELYQFDTGHGLCLDIKHIRLFLAGYIK